ncbi:Bax inhibitor-1/YccA family protein [Microbacterium sp. EYE_5]|uniref:Bax inhibitor-1/YccA family protein n=1 Tax=unclassified Microbacterium TaxID=2609290 RepID=UPI002005C216|nr:MULTISPECIES: Bax inhibitor-1/YccA family protein [unclassified Microbacterium]MCK6081717.1 Bax inhibitor-1/YccA family protein [Microbacterium sp. EYE_382]MCK6086987.1 Bax inhibitor-1/YccA family protein [Microbacterium sp. EYE_384]MCK6123515.1 Bax inhibitor-1/YccA family protein [Microbacterium sp. EYE_80]MCK6126424.1 Bax inhibitor-1/YccA family protein [Microbacterium sp. EYE_79]MCK6142671.1 Bax inhibitor-1/YccA family protein [Microbacterium sp. EYE_39]
MAASGNFAFNNPVFQEDQRRPGLTPPAAQTNHSAASHQAADVAASAQLEGMYAAPAASSNDTGRMTVEDTVVKTAGLFGILLVTALVGWFWTLGGSLMPTEVDPANLTIMPWIIGALVGFVLALVITFTSRKKVRPALIWAYAAAEGLFVGGISAYFEFIWPGVVLQATIATLVVVGVTLALFASGKVRVSKKANKIFMIAMVSYLVFGLVNLVLMWTGVTEGTFGLYSQEIFGIPLGLVIGLLVVLMASYSLVQDFDMVQQGARNGAPREFGWVGAFGIMVTVVWLYVEILRIIAILRGSD